ncbi:PREDICTED: SET domain-containing protein 9 [Galeopterus variegatus]|uniref:SET domain-containing protein 9 n=1 Tax=Galeopterus variegatus TaxID=482537 RepID=A0ABM0QGH4_GALVR|nr:PREDICTED: SET domain-containing protein 9 [Galeopterus variegatus]
MRPCRTECPLQPCDSCVGVRESTRMTGEKNKQHGAHRTGKTVSAEGQVPKNRETKEFSQCFIRRRLCRTLRYVPEESKDKVISDEDVLGTLLKVFQALFLNDFSKQSDILAVLPEPVKSKYQDLLGVQHQRVKLLENRHQQQNIFQPEEILYTTLGFSVARASSSLISAGKGVFVTKGLVPKGAVVSMYPGTVYQKYEPIFFQSIGNAFIFRCLDGVLIDGNDKGISKAVYKSCNGRDRLGPLKMSDSTWLTSEINNPLAVGQYVNNCSNDRAANVCYQEFDVPAVFPIELKQYLPNITYSYDKQSPLRCVVLVALRDIKQGEELFSNYYTIVS